MSQITRRDLLKGAAAAGAVAAAPQVLRAQAKDAETLNVAIIGTGDHGRDLLNFCRSLPGLKFRAVCDIWDYRRTYAARLLKKFKHAVNDYVDYRDMLAKEKDLDAVIIASPDGFHEEQAVACLEAGVNVYLEKEMALTIEGARNVVGAARKAGKLLQVGRQHRSNQRYHRALELIDQHKALGRLTQFRGQWQGHRREKFGWPEGKEVDPAVLKKYGYESMEQFRNWRFFSKFAAGEMASLGSHQLDVFHWFLHGPPKSVYAAGGLDYYDYYELYDNISCVYEWDYDWGGRKTTVRGTYHIANTTELGGFYETFTGTEGEISISEIATRGGVWRDRNAPVAPWEEELQGKAVKEFGSRGYGSVPATDTKRVYWHHLGNFFDAIRGKGKLACPGELGFEVAVSAFKTIESMKTGQPVKMTAEDFKV